MNPTPPPSVESELLSGLYTDEEKAQILGQIEEAAAANHLTIDVDTFRPRKRGILFPVLVNVAAVGLVIGAWFGADAYFQDRQKGLQLKTDQMFSTESKLLAKVLEDSKNQLAAKNAEIDKIKGDLERITSEKADLQKSFADRISLREQQLRQEMDDALAAEKKRLQDSGLGAAEVAQKLKEFAIQKDAEFNERLQSYRREVQEEINQRTLAVTALQSKLQSTVSEQESLRKEIEKQTQAREKDLQTQLSSQAADIDQLKRDRDDLAAFYHQADTAMNAVRAAFEAGEWPQTQSALLNLRQVLAKASASASEAVRARALAQSVMASTLDSAVTTLSGSTSKADLKREQELAALQLAESQKTLAEAEARWKQAQTEVEDLKAKVDTLTQQLTESTAKLADSTNQVDTLKTQVADLQKTIDDLTPYKTRQETLTNLFGGTYASARQRFLTTLGSESGLTVFPNFDPAWQELSRETQDTNTADAVRHQALDDVLKFTSYLQGTAIDPQVARDTSEKLARADGTFRQVVDSIQTLASSGATESKVSTVTTQLYGTVAAVSGTRVTLEPLTKVKPQPGQEIELRRIAGKKETILGRGKVLVATDQKVDLDWTGNAVPPLSGDPAYLVLP